jgi:hypothetical protein
MSIRCHSSTSQFAVTSLDFHVSMFAFTFSALNPDDDPVKRRAMLKKACDDLHVSAGMMPPPCRTG